jgi:hypothetical protein
LRHRGPPPLPDLCDGDPKGRAYCCGLTFEVFLDAWKLWCHRQARPWRIRDLDLEDVRRLQSQWFGSKDDRTCLRTAFVENGLGTRLLDFEKAQPGDFVQLWRNNGSGHSGKNGEISGLRYWSTQNRTNGVGEATETFGSRPNEMKRDEFYLCRAGV